MEPHICFLFVVVLCCQVVLGAFVQRKQRSGDVLAEMQVVCNSDAILLKVLTSKPFNGMIYAKDATTGRSCMSEYNDSTNMTYSLPLKSCGTSFAEIDDGVEYYNTLVVQPHMRLMTNQGKSYKVRCKYMTKERSVSNVHFNVSASFLMSNEQTPVSTPLYATASMPSCSMKIFKSGRDHEANTVKIGDKLIMIIEIDQQDIYGMRVSNCLVRDGTNSMEQQLIDENGCPTDELIMQKFDYSHNFTRASVSFLAHKFPHSSSVYYQCNVRLCISAGAGCSEPNCANQQAPGGTQRRRKRSSAGELLGTNSTSTSRAAVLAPRPAGGGRSLSGARELSFDVYSGLHVDDLDNGSASENVMDLLLPEERCSQQSYCNNLFRGATYAMVGVAVSCVAILALLVIKLMAVDQQVRKETLPVEAIRTMTNL